MVAQFLAHKPVNSASLTDSFIVSFSKLLKLWSWMQTYSSQENQNNFPGPEKLPGLSRKEPQGTRISPASYEHHPGGYWRHLAGKHDSRRHSATSLARISWWRKQVINGSSSFIIVRYWEGLTTLNRTEKPR